MEVWFTFYIYKSKGELRLTNNQVYFFMGANKDTSPQKKPFEIWNGWCNQIYTMTKNFWVFQSVEHPVYEVSIHGINSSLPLSSSLCCPQWPLEVLSYAGDRTMS